jgi:hypothetical protein
VLLGRERELAAIGDVCRAAAAGHGSALVVAGEPGIGKTALLAAAVAADPGTRQLRATGVEAESTVAFATLQGLLWPLREELDELESGQAALLTGVLDLGPQLGASTFAIGAATLALLSVDSRDEACALVYSAQPPPPRSSPRSQAKWRHRHKRRRPSAVRSTALTRPTPHC